MTDQMTPDKARDLLDGTTPGPWEWEDCIGDGGVRHMALRNPAGEKSIITEDAESYQSGVRGTPADLRLAASSPTLAAMIAGMRTEYRTEEWRGLVIGWVPTSPWTAEKPVGGSDPHTRLVRRYVTTPEEA